MRIRLTLCSGPASARDVELRVPAGTTLGSVRAMLASAGQDSCGPTVWTGTRAVPDSALLGGPGLRSGCELGIDAPVHRVLSATSILRMHVVCGPDAGLVVGLGRGLVTVGRAPDCDVRLTDPDCSRQHLCLTATASGLSVRDLGSTNGAHLLHDDGSAAEAIDADGVRWEIGQHIRLGETILCLTAVTTTPALTTLDDDGRLTLNRPPRLVTQLPAREVAFEPPDRRGDRAALPWLAALIPAAGGAGLAWFLHNAQFLIFALLSPVVLLGTSLGDRLSGRRGRRRDGLRRRRQLEGRKEELRVLARAETHFRRSAHPDPAALLQTAQTPDARIWERRRPDCDFLTVRVGLADRPAAITVRRGTETLDSPTLAAVPVTADLRIGPLGICGPRPLALGTARWVIGQLAVLHSPTDVRVVAMLADDAGGWSALRWLPHLRAPGTSTAGPIAHTAQQRLDLLSSLTAIVEDRLDGSRTTHQPWSGPWIVVLVDRAAQHAGLPGLGRLLHRGPAVGVTAVCLDDEARRLPAACTTVAELTGESGTRVRLRTATTDEVALADRVAARWIDQVARALCPLRDPDDHGDTALATSSRLLELIDGSLEPASMRRRWASTNGAASAVVGVSVDGPFTIDLERDGPHTLVAGTTGAGKSELLQTLVASLALHVGPDDLQFVLIDYKGGAAFADCARLPHTGGLVTDLDSQLTERALLSLNAELTRREMLFASAGARDLAAYRRTEYHHTDRLGRLVLVVDEFAALAEELPDFVTGLVGIAQRGRSLGVHLVLATQRPGGVVSPEIRANTALRIALRVTDPGESGDVIGCDDAAAIDKRSPGRAFARTGTALTEIQTARVSGFPPPSAPPIQLVPLDDWGRPVEEASAPTASGRTDLQLLVEAALGVAADMVLPRRPWLDPLPDLVDMTTLVASSEVVGADHRLESGFCVPFALADRPDAQRQDAERIDLSRGATMLYCGGPASGRSTALRTIAARAAELLSPAQLHLQVIDCAGGALRPLSSLPHCGSLLTRADPPAVDRLLQRLTAEVGRRHALLAELGVGTVCEARARGHELAVIVVLLDGWEGFVAATEEIDAGRPVDTFLHLLRDGSSVGVTILIAGDRATLATRLSSAVQRRLILRMSDPADYALAGLHRRAVPSHLRPGRAVDAADGTQLQLAVLGQDPAAPAQLARVRDIGRRAVSRQSDEQRPTGSQWRVGSWCGPSRSACIGQTSPPPMTAQRSSSEPAATRQALSPSAPSARTHDSLSPEPRDRGAAQLSSRLPPSS